MDVCEALYAEAIFHDANTHHVGEKLVETVGPLSEHVQLDRTYRT